MPTYKMRSGDTPEKVSAKFGMNVLDLYKANKGTYQYKPGVTIKVPGTGRQPTTFGKTRPPTTEPTTGKVLYPGTVPTNNRAFVEALTGPVTNKTTSGGGGGVVYPTAEDIYESSGAHMKENDWSDTMGANVGEITAEQWRRGVRPKRISKKNQGVIGVEDNWMRENGYVLIGDVWVRASGGEETEMPEDRAKPTPPPTTTTSNLGPYTENVQWRVGTG